MFRNQFRTFDLYDLVVELIPGAVFLLVVSYVLPADSAVTTLLLSSGLAGAISVVALAYLVGTAFHAVASNRTSRLKEFQHRMRAVRAGEPRNAVDAATWPGIVRFFDLPESYLDPPTAGGSDGPADGWDSAPEQQGFWVVYSYLVTNEIGRVRRLEALFAFVRSSFVVGTVCAGLLAASTACMAAGLYTNAFRSVPATATAAVAFGLSAYVFYGRKDGLDAAHDGNVINAFYANVVAQGPGVEKPGQRDALTGDEAAGTTEAESSAQQPTESA